MTEFSRRRLLALAAATPALYALPALANEERLTGDVVIGDENAPLTVIEYASLTCSHCASFHKRTWPEFKANYVDTGKVRFIMREVYFDPYGLWAGMLARCGGREAYYPMVDQILNRQAEWSRAEDVAVALKKIGRVNGLSSERMNACMTDRPFAEALIADYQNNAEADGIRSTPSFVIEGDVHTGAMGYDEFSALVERYLGS
ncbi:MAG: DsbA family protein [Pseudomonadota bacterium]